MPFPNLLQEKFYLRVPFADKEDAKSAGAKWDKELKLWFLPPGLDPLDVRRWWSFLGNAYDDKETIKKMGAKFDGRLKKWWVPVDKLDFDDFSRWWPQECRQYLFEDCFCCHEQVADSGQAVVYRAWDLQENDWCAIKLFHEDKGSWDLSEEASKRELDALLNLEGHQNILPLKGYNSIEEPKRYYTVTHWVEHNLSEIMGEEGNEKFTRLFYRLLSDNGYVEEDTEDEFVESVMAEVEGEADDWCEAFDFLLSGILEGIAHAHDRHIIHRDIKPKNIFFDLVLGESEDDDIDEAMDDFKVVPIIGDFGASKNLSLESYPDDNKTLREFRTFPWTPPPRDNDIYFQATLDLYAWAAIAVAYTCDIYPRTDNEIREALDGSFKEAVSEEIHGAITEALDPDPARRPQDTHKYLEKIKTLTEKLKKELDL